MERNKPRLNYLSDMLFCTLCDRYSLSGLLFSPAARLALWVGRFRLLRRCRKAKQCLTLGLHHFSGNFFLAIVSHRRLVSSLLRSTSSCLRAVSLSLSLKYRAPPWSAIRREVLPILFVLQVSNWRSTFGKKMMHTIEWTG